MKIKSILTIAAVVFSTVAFSQITKGKISYDVYLSSDNPQMAPMLSQIESSTVDMFFSGDKVRTEMSIGEFSTNQTVMLKGAETSLMLMDNMYMGKVAIKPTKEEMGDQIKAMEVTEVEFIDGETKKILGYTCKKAIIHIGEEGESDVWYTEEIVPDYRAGQFLFEKIPGLPLEMSSRMMGMDMKLVAYEFSGKISKKQEEKLFSMDVPKGYTLKNYEEVMKFGR